MDLAVWAELFASEERVGNNSIGAKMGVSLHNLSYGICSLSLQELCLGEFGGSVLCGIGAPKTREDICKQSKMKDVLCSESSRRDEI